MEDSSKKIPQEEEMVYLTNEKAYVIGDGKTPLEDLERYLIIGGTKEEIDKLKIFANLSVES